MRRMFATVIAMFLGVGTVGVDAHHSYSEFQDQTASVEGSIMAVEFANPHTTMTLRTTDGAVYTATWNAAFQLARMGVRQTDLNIGDVVMITGHSHRDPTVHELAKLREVRRLRDGWAWKSEDGRVTVTAGRR